MKKKPLCFFVLFVVISLVITSCSSSGRMGGSKKGCGCGVHKGYVGY